MVIFGCHNKKCIRFCRQCMVFRVLALWVIAVIGKRKIARFSKCDRNLWQFLPIRGNKLSSLNGLAFFSRRTSQHNYLQRLHILSYYITGLLECMDLVMV